MGFGRETTFGTGVTSTAGLNFISASLKTTKETKILETVETNRAFTKRIGLSRTIEGDVEFYIDPDNNAFAYLMENAFGAVPITATATSETTGGLAFTHTFSIGNIQDASYTSLSINMRKGDSAAGQVFEYVGARVNELTFSAEIDDALICTASMMIKDSTATTNDVASSITGRQTDCLNFTNGRISVETSFAALTTTSFWHVQSMEFGLANSLKSDTGSRRIGSDVLQVLPPGMASFTFNTTIRFDTTTAYDAMLAETQLAAQFEFLGDTLATSSIRQGLKLTMPEVFIMDAGDPEVGGPDEILTADVTFAVLRDDSSASGFAIQAELTNATTSYA